MLLIPGEGNIEVLVLHSYTSGRLGWETGWILVNLRTQANMKLNIASRMYFDNWQ